MSSTPQSLILGAYSDLPVRHLEPFVRSLRATAFKGSLCIVAGRCEPAQRAQLRQLADSLVDVSGEYSTALAAVRSLLGYLRRTRGLRRTYAPVFQAVARVTTERASFLRWSSLEYHLEGLQALRYLHYYRYLVSRDPAPDFVMLTDLRDVIFQRDPFSEPVSGLEVYLEDESVRVGKDTFNTRWIDDLFGPEVLRAMHGRPVSCSGTVVGTREAMLVYLAEMVAHIAWRRRPMGPHDQAVHNRLIACDRLPGATVVPNGHGRVLTLGAVKTLHMSLGGDVLNADGSVPAVLHQWDRHASLVSHLERRAATSASESAS